MQLVIKPHDGSLEALLAANAYRRLWHDHKQAILDAFHGITGLAFQQHTITAHVFLDSDASAGKWRDPMHLPAYAPDDQKLLTLVHELCHRLLGGNALSPFGLGLLDDVQDFSQDDEFQEYDHRHTYLFEYDVVQKALGDKYAEKCREMNTASVIDGPHGRAWDWAMSMKPTERQRAMKCLAAEALPRDRWDERDGKPITLRNPAVWFTTLANPETKTPDNIVLS